MFTSGWRYNPVVHFVNMGSHIWAHCKIFYRFISEAGQMKTMKAHQMYCICNSKSQVFLHLLHHWFFFKIMLRTQVLVNTHNPYYLVIDLSFYLLYLVFVRRVSMAPFSIWHKLTPLIVFTTMTTHVQMYCIAQRSWWNDRLGFI